jgi:hypothetical protein
MARRSLFVPVALGLNTNMPRDRRYTMTAVTKTTNKLGPSGSLKNMNITREQIRDVMANISHDVFLDFKFI